MFDDSVNVCKVFFTSTFSHTSVPSVSTNLNILVSATINVCFRTHRSVFLHTIRLLSNTLSGPWSDVMITLFGCVSVVYITFWSLFVVHSTKTTARRAAAAANITYTLLYIRRRPMKCFHSWFISGIDPILALAASSQSMMSCSASRAEASLTNAARSSSLTRVVPSAISRMRSYILSVILSF